MSTLFPSAQPPASSAPSQSPFKFQNQPSTFSSDEASRPKSPKGATIPNPLINNLQYGAAAAPGSGMGSTPQRSAFYPRRTPLTPLGATNTSQRGPAGIKSSMKKSSVSKTPVPPPKMSLSLNESSIFQMQTDVTMATTPKGQPSPMVTRPSPMQSPTFPSARSKLHTSNFTASGLSPMQQHAAGADDNWVVGFGFGSTSMGQYHELLDALSSCGTIQQRISGGNWVAVQFTSRYAAEKAISSQPIYSRRSNTYFGISRVTPDRLRMLQVNKQSNGASTTITNGSDGNAGTGSSKPQQQQLFDSYPSSGKKLEEKDVLLGDSVEEDDYLDRPREPRGPCDRFLAWYFGWQYDAPLADKGKVHTD